MQSSDTSVNMHEPDVNSLRKTNSFEIILTEKLHVTRLNKRNQSTKEHCRANHASARPTWGHVSGHAPSQGSPARFCLFTHSQSFLTDVTWMRIHGEVWLRALLKLQTFSVQRQLMSARKATAACILFSVSGAFAARLTFGETFFSGHVYT